METTTGGDWMQSLKIDIFKIQGDKAMGQWKRCKWKKRERKGKVKGERKSTEKMGRRNAVKKKEREWETGKISYSRLRKGGKGR